MDVSVKTQEFGMKGGAFSSLLMISCFTYLIQCCSVQQNEQDGHDKKFNSVTNMVGNNQKDGEGNTLIMRKRRQVMADKAC